MRRRLIRGALLLAFLFLGSATWAPAAHAGALDGSWPQSVSSCNSNVRVGTPRSLYGSEGSYYGWAEFRQGTSGSCRDYQWVKIHFVNILNIRNVFGIYIYRTQRSNVVSMATFWDTRTFPAGTWTNSMMFYNTQQPSAYLYGTVYGPPGSNDVEFGVHGEQGGRLNNVID